MCVCVSTEYSYTLHVAISLTGPTHTHRHSHPKNRQTQSQTGFCSQTEVLERWTACGYVLKWPLIVCCLQLQRNVAYYSMLYVWQVEFAALYVPARVCVCVVVACWQTKEQFNEIAKKIVATYVYTHTHRDTCPHKWHCSQRELKL